MTKKMTIREASIKFQVTVQSFYFAIKNGKLPAKKMNRKWIIEESALQNYRENKYSRDHSTFQGKKKFDEKEGTFSLLKAAEFLQIDYQRLYYLLRSGKVNASRKGCSWVFDKKDLMNLKEITSLEMIL